MTDRGLFIFVEGPDDERFVSSVLVPLYQDNYSWVNLYLYSRKKPKLICDFINSIYSMNSDCLLLGDLNSHPCASSKKEELLVRYPVINQSNIVIVMHEIESWYLAGLSLDMFKLNVIAEFNSTDEIDKEGFNKIIPKKFISRIDFMQDILRNYSLELAIDKNTSLHYLTNKYSLL